MGLGYRYLANEYGYIEVVNDGTDDEGIVLLNRHGWYLFGTFQNHNYDDDGLIEKIYNLQKDVVISFNLKNNLKNDNDN